VTVTTFVKNAATVFVVVTVAVDVDVEVTVAGTTWVEKAATVIVF